MADFVAVIRRAVDGLSDNTPEMRVKVYERARGAVQRQLESMKPRPPETMLQRQLEKLEAAIRDVETEHAEASAAAGSAVEAVAEPYQAPAERNYQPEPEPAYHATAPEEAPPAAAEDPASVEETPPVADEAPAYHAEQIAPVEPAPSAAVTERQEDHWQVEPEPPVQQREPAYHAPEPVQPAWQDQRRDDLASSIDALHRQLGDVTPETVAGIPRDAVITETHTDAVHAENAGHFDDVWPETARAEVADDTDIAWPTSSVEHAAPTAIPVNYPPDVGFASADETVARMPEAVEPFSWEAATFDDLPPVKPVAAAAPLLPTPAGHYDDVDLFSDVHGIPAKPAANAAPADGWNELKELSGYEKFAAENDLAASEPVSYGRAGIAGMQGKSYRMEPRRSRFGVVGVLVTLVCLVIVGGAGYAAWMNRTALNSMVSGLVSSATKNSSVASKTSVPAAPTAATAPSTTSPVAPPAAGTVVQPASPANTNVAALDNDGNTVNSKFTQRLMPDGSEVDAGVPPVAGGAVAAEGKSIAQQNVAAATSAPASGTPTGTSASPAPAAPAADATPAPAAVAAAAPAAVMTPPAAAAAGATPATAPPAPTETATVGTPEKMFLYEERLGQASPTAIVGSVTWSVQEDKGDDGKPSPTVQGSVNVPDRGMTALITFKRNTDPSLPASHLIEIVFSLPPNFEGGAIDSVQRVAMKATEQDRGDPLVAVPAKITDDFHMVALNDFPDARKTNLDLLRSRDWIDIPVTYRNGRRALLTMEKGQTGTDAFNKVIGEWAAIGNSSSQ
jgi:hypothetical protein